MKTCPNCSKTFPDEYQFCLADGSDLISSQTETETQNSSSIKTSQFWENPIVYLAGGLGVILLILGVIWFSSSSQNDTPNVNKSFVANASNAGSFSNAANMSYSSNSDYQAGKNGRLTTDANLRSEPNKDSLSLGIHFKDAKVVILDETSYERDGMVSTWYKIRVTDYGCSKDANLGCGKNSPNDSDEGWVNAKTVIRIFERFIKAEK